LAGCGRQRKQRDRRKPQNTRNAMRHASPGNRNVYHA
jgi:hypothetical protein